MILYVNGDSHSKGHDAVVQDIPAPEDDSEEGWQLFSDWQIYMKEKNLEVSYGNVLAKKLNAELVCEAEAGCSNDSIIDRTLKYLETNTPDFIIIGWSTWERETWYYAGEEYNITASGTDTVHPDLKEKYKQWVIDQSRPEAQWHKEFTTHDKIWNLHNQLKHIPHLFFNCYSHFFYTEHQNKPKYDWSNSYIGPYTKDQTYYFWLEQQGFKPSNPKHFHYGADAHAAWAEFLLPKVQTVLTQNE